MSVAYAGSKLSETAFAITVALSVPAVVISLAVMRFVDQALAVKLGLTAAFGVFCGFVWRFALTLVVSSVGPIVALVLFVALAGAFIGMLSVALRDSTFTLMDVAGCALGTTTAIAADTLGQL